MQQLNEKLRELERLRKENKNTETDAALAKLDKDLQDIKNRVKKMYHKNPLFALEPALQKKLIDISERMRQGAQPSKTGKGKRNSRCHRNARSRFTINCQTRQRPRPNQ